MFWTFKFIADVKIGFLYSLIAVADTFLCSFWVNVHKMVRPVLSDHCLSCPVCDIAVLCICKVIQITRACGKDFTIAEQSIRLVKNGL